MDLFFTLMLRQAFTYTNDVRPIFVTNCSECHNSRGPGKNWLNYDVAYENRARIRERVWYLRDMPLGRQMAEEDRRIIKQWVDQGAAK